METSFWQERWTARDLGFHQPRPHPLLVKHFTALTLPQGSRVFVPLCGKTLDIAWLLSRGYCVIGSELVKTAVDELFAELGIKPAVEKTGAHLLYRAAGIEIFVGDIFELNEALVGEVDAIYDRAALVALPSEMRRRYAAHLQKITRSAPQLLICFEYDQRALAGPPFSVDADEVRRLYGTSYNLRQLERTELESGLKGKCPALEIIWTLQPIHHNQQEAS